MQKDEILWNDTVSTEIISTFELLVTACYNGKLTWIHTASFYQKVNKSVSFDKNQENRCPKHNAFFFFWENSYRTQV